MSSSSSSSASSSSIYHPNYDDDVDDMFDVNELAAEEAIKEAVKVILDEEATSSRQTRRPPKSRDRITAHEKLVRDYFSDNPVYDNRDFERRFRMTRRLFRRIVADLEREYEFFKWSEDARGVKGFSPLQKCTSAIRQLAYGIAADSTDEYLQMSETTSRECFTNFCQGIIHLYMRKYLRKPTANDVQSLFALHEQQHGLPGMLGSIDCMHWDWKNCPVAWRGQYHRGDHEGPTTVLEAVASYDGWFWHAYYGTPGATNDIVVVNHVRIMCKIVTGFTWWWWRFPNLDRRTKAAAVAAVGRRWRRWLFEFDAATPPIVVVAVDGGCFHESRSSGDGGGCGRCCRRVRGDGGGCGCCCRRTHGGGGGVKRLPSLVVWRWWRRGFNFTGISGSDGGNRCCRRRDRDRQPRRRSTAAGWWRRLLPVVLDWAAMVTFVVVLAGGNKPLFNGHD
ncbi:hypothetical protein OSB04_030728 [Centaurea solstitialis]|uniref:Harbinger transposase-derived protein n=1 Tax=Centaurea solstitialis TaxID=347529 RepID=A0AA38W442_9ASTR|nr:hypothetical protein OSB04_030728 [Centaurea solstitialis]